MNTFETVNTVDIQPGRDQAGLYIHFPFCVRKCTYCDFFSVPYDRDLVVHYLRALMMEAELVAAEESWGNIATIYLGGGTPSLMEPAWIEDLLNVVGRRFRVEKDCEITLEVNPGTVELNRLRGLKAAGINRLSLGIQSLNDDELKILGRIHSSEEARQVVDWIRQAGFSNYGLDLIYGIPRPHNRRYVQRRRLPGTAGAEGPGVAGGRSGREPGWSPARTLRRDGGGQVRYRLAAWQKTLREAVALDPRHISAYLLQMDEGVPLAAAIAQGRMHSLADDEEAAMYAHLRSYLGGKGYEHYEISNFCRPGYTSRHNINYWMSGDYLGLGAGAVSFNGGRRWHNIADIPRYNECLKYGQRPPQETLEELQGRDRVIDALIMGLRMTHGVDIEELSRRFRLDVAESFADQIAGSCREGLLKWDGSRLRLTTRGYFLSNQVFRAMLG